MNLQNIRGKAVGEGPDQHFSLKYFLKNAIFEKILTDSGTFLGSRGMTGLSQPGDEWKQ